MSKFRDNRTWQAEERRMSVTDWS